MNWANYSPRACMEQKKDVKMPLMTPMFESSVTPTVKVLSSSLKTNLQIRQTGKTTEGRECILFQIQADQSNSEWF